LYHVQFVQLGPGSAVVVVLQSQVVVVPAGVVVVVLVVHSTEVPIAPDAQLVYVHSPSVVPQKLGYTGWQGSGVVVDVVLVVEVVELVVVLGSAVVVVLVVVGQRQSAGSPVVEVVVLVGSSVVLTTPVRQPSFARDQAASAAFQIHLAVPAQIGNGEFAPPGPGVVVVVGDVFSPAAPSGTSHTQRPLGSAWTSK
jgi:hypothetical protein